MRDRRSGGAKIVKRPVIVAAIVLAVTFGLVVPIFTDLGTLEAGGVAALIAMGGFAWRDLLRPALAARP